MENNMMIDNTAIKTRKALIITLAIMWALIILIGIAAAVLLIISNVRLPGLF